MSDEQEDIGFEKAEFEAEPPKRSSCALCQRDVHGTYWELGGRLSCTDCKTRLDGEIEHAYSFATFWRASYFGAGAAIVGSFVWYWFGKITGIELSLIAILIGIFIGLAIKRATGGHGGRRYQALAMFLTYSAIVWTYVPRILEEVRKPHPAQVAPGAAGSVEVMGVAPVAPAASASPPTTTSESAPAPPPSLGKYLLAWSMLIGFAYAVPFLGGVEGLLGLLIIGIGLFEAWRHTRRVPITVSGPHSLHDDDG